MTGELGSDVKYCPECGNELRRKAAICPKCGVEQPGYERRSATFELPTGKSRMLAGVLAILLGWLGVHRFYMGQPAWGVVLLAGSFLLVPVTFIWGIVDGVRILTHDDEWFQEHYLNHPDLFKL